LLPQVERAAGERRREGAGLIPGQEQGDVERRHDRWLGRELPDPSRGRALGPPHTEGCGASGWQRGDQRGTGATEDQERRDRRGQQEVLPDLHREELGRQAIDRGEQRDREDRKAAREGEDAPEERTTWHAATPPQAHRAIGVERRDQREARQGQCVEAVARQRR